MVYVIDMSDLKFVGMFGDRWDAILFMRMLEEEHDRDLRAFDSTTWTFSQDW